jgi:hypothetical protein
MSNKTAFFVVVREYCFDKPKQFRSPGIRYVTDLARATNEVLDWRSHFEFAIPTTCFVTWDRQFGEGRGVWMIS